jgi:S1-C subfamily serine protease
MRDDWRARRILSVTATSTIVFLFCTVALYLSTGGASYGQQSAQQIQTLIDQSKRAVVKLYVTGTTHDGIHTTGNGIEGSGFFAVSNAYSSYIITARHVIGSSVADPNSNPDWKVDIDGTIERQIRIESFDERGNLGPIQAEVTPWPTTDPTVDIAILKIDRGPYPTLSLGSSLLTNSPLRHVLLLGFPGGSDALSKTPKIGFGQPAGLSFITNVPTEEGESGGPWIDLENKNVLAVARKIDVRKTNAEYDSSPIDLVEPVIDVIQKKITESETNTSIPLREKTELSTSTATNEKAPTQQSDGMYIV